MTILGFTIWATKEEDHIRAGQRRIGDAFHGIADDLEEARRLHRERSGLPPLSAPTIPLPPARAKKAAKGEAE